MTAGLLATDPVTLGPYRLLARLGGGGMGQVFLATAPSGGLVAVKVIRPEFAADLEFRARFTREVANARNVSGRFTAAPLDADTEGPFPWLATAYIPGPALSAAVREHGPLPMPSLLPLGAGLAKALAAIHATGIVHRDLKPSNVLLATDGPRVIDFGISHAVEATTLTQTGAVMGSPGYMSPEQAQGRPVGPASDVFSLGAVLAFAATGGGPFGEGSVAALVYRVVNETPDLERVPPELRSLVARCLGKEPGERPDPLEVVAELTREPVLQAWLPEAIADTLPRYEGAARIAALDPLAPVNPLEQVNPALADASALEPAATGPAELDPATGSSPAVGANLTTGSSPAAAGAPAGAGFAGVTPAAPRTARPSALRRLSLPPRLRRPWLRHHRRAVTAIAVAIAVLLATGLTLGSGMLGRHAGGTAAPLLSPSAKATPTTAARTSQALATQGGHGPPTASPPSPTPTAVTRTTPTSAKQSAPAAAAATPAANATTSAVPPTTPSARHSSPASSPASSAPVSSAGDLSATNATLHSCGNHPIAGATSTSASFEWVNNSSNTVYVYYTESSVYAGLTGSIPPNSSLGSTLAVGGTYLVDGPIGTCLGYITIDGTSGEVTIS
ncbi:MAG TPA: serine/threonine-protein kinase [Trebonia sp.]|nr:serine/threonine-protein kinase [Trebonia sp.]